MPLSFRAIGLLWVIFPLCLWGQPPSVDFSWQSYPVPSKGRGTQILASENGYLYVGAEGEILRFDGRRWGTIALSEAQYVPVSSLADGPNGSIWVGLENGNIFELRADSAKQFSSEEGLPKAPIRSIVFDSAGLMWIGTYGEGVYFYAGNRLYQIDDTEGLPSLDVYALSVHAKGEVWAATDQGIGICRWDAANRKKQVRRLEKKDGLPDEIILSLAHQAGDSWIGTYDKGGFTQPEGTGSWQTIDSLCARRFVKLIASPHHVFGKTKLGEVWELTGSGPSRRLILPEFAVDLCTDATGRLWILDELGELKVAQPFVKRVSLEKGVPRMKIPLEPQALTHKNDSELWIAAQAGVWVYNKLTETVRLIPGTEDLSPTSLYQDTFGNLWIGTLRSGLWQLNAQESLRPVFLPSLRKGVPILSISGNGQDLWLATLAGAYHCQLDSKGEITSESILSASPEAPITYIYQATLDPDGKVCFSTDGQGLVRLAGETLISAPLLEGSTFYAHCYGKTGELYGLDAKGHVLRILPDQLDTLYTYERGQALALLPFGTAHLLAVFQDALRLIDPQNGRHYPFLSHSEKGTLDMGQALHVHSIGPDGDIWIGRPGELLCLSPQEMPARLQPRLTLESLSIRLEPTELAQQTFAPSDNHLSWNYTAFWWDAPEAISFRHRLIGHDLDWVESRDQRAMYPSLQPGDYTFELEACIDGDYSQAERLSSSIHIRRPFWMSLWFWGICLLSIVAGVYFFFRRREQLALKKQEQERLLAENQFETLRNQINPHFLFNAFSTLIDLVEESPDHAVRYINRLSDMFRDVLTYRDKPLITLSQELAILDNYYQLQKERYGENFSLRIHIEEPQKALFVPPMILQILVENALKHNKVSARFPLWIDIKAHAGSLTISNPIQLRTVSSASTQVGLANIRSRYALLTDHPIQVSDDDSLFSVTLPLLTNASTS